MKRRQGRLRAIKFTIDALAKGSVLPLAELRATNPERTKTLIVRAEQTSIVVQTEYSDIFRMTGNIFRRT